MIEKIDNSSAIVSLPDVQDISVQNQTYSFGFFETIGKRKRQEDALAWQILDPTLFAALNPIEIGYRLWTSYLFLDLVICKHTPSGTTACTTVYDGRRNLITASVGDSVSFAALYDENKSILAVIRLTSLIHKPTNKNEYERIKAAGGFIRNYRVDGDMAITRGIGDNRKKLKQHGFTAESTIDITSFDELAKLIPAGTKLASVKIINTCDGFTDGARAADCRYTQQTFLYELLKNKPGHIQTEADISKYLAILAIQFGSTDNVSVSIQTINLDNSVLVNSVIFTGVYDGHGKSNYAAHFVARNIVRMFTSQCAFTPEKYSAQNLSVSKLYNEFLRDNNRYNILPPKFKTDYQEEFFSNAAFANFIEVVHTVQTKTLAHWKAEEFALRNAALTFHNYLISYLEQYNNQVISYDVLSEKLFDLIDDVSRQVGHSDKEWGDLLGAVEICLYTLAKPTISIVPAPARITTSEPKVSSYSLFAPASNQLMDALQSFITDYHN